jgi:hypothetical protein
MKVGDVMTPVKGPHSGLLACGSGIYTHAILVSAEPFVMVSEEGDMLWGSQRSADFVALCQAHPEACKRAFDRYERETGKRPMLGEEV